MKQTEIVRLFSQAEGDAFFEKLFREKRTAAVNSAAVYEVKLNGRTWFRRGLSRAFHSLICTAYQIDNYLIVWENHSDKPIFMAKSELPFTCICIGELDFMLRVETPDKNFFFERCIWQPSENEYKIDVLPIGEVPEEMDKAIDMPPSHREHIWNRIYVMEEGIRSIDNSIFYKFIVNWWE